MKVIDQSVKLWSVPSYNIDSVGTLKHIERCGRVCYRSEESIKGDSYKRFIANIVDRGHLSVLRHSNLVLRTKRRDGVENYAPRHKYLNYASDAQYYYVSGNYQAWFEFAGLTTSRDFFRAFEDNPLVMAEALPFGDMWEVCDFDEIPTELLRLTFFCITDRAVSHEAVRHTTCDFLQESQRYCAYRDELEFINIDWWAKPTKTAFNSYAHLVAVESMYKDLLKNGAKPEQARAVLPNCTATRFVLTTDVPGLEHFFKMRCSPAAYKPIRALATTMKEIVQPVISE